MAKNQWIGKYYVGEDGKWVKGEEKTAWTLKNAEKQVAAELDT